MKKNRLAAWKESTLLKDIVERDSVMSFSLKIEKLFFSFCLTKAEFRGLTLRDIDLENKVINIDHQLQRTSDMRLVIEFTKTNAGTRKLPMTGDVAKSGMNPKTLQYLMGHSDIGVTLNTYTHLGLEDATDELKRMEELENARKELEKNKEEKPVSQKMFRQFDKERLLCALLRQGIFLFSIPQCLKLC